MKKVLAMLMAFSMALSLAACAGQPAEQPQVSEQPVATAAPEPSAEPSQEPAGLYTPGTYTSSAMGFGGNITVTIVFDANAVTDVQVDGPGETAGIGSMAIEKLPKAIKTAQSAEVDAVAGATTSSKAIKTAAADCFLQATGQSANAVADGTYSATAVSYSWTGMLTCDVTFAGGKLTDIKIAEEFDSATSELCYSAYTIYIPRLIEAQSLAVDAVAGATVTSGAIRTCVEDAIVQAGGSAADWQTPVQKSTEHVKLEGYDVIVVGLGGSGIAAYGAAAQQGATVFGIEKTAKLGGQSATTTGPMAVNSKNLKDKYFDGKDYMDADALYKTWIEYVESEEKADIIQKAVYESGTILDWAMDSFDFSFDGRNGMLGSFAVPEWTALWTAYTADENNTSFNILGPNKTYQFDRAMEKAVAMNEKNDYELELTATELLFDGENIVGVKAVRYDGATYEIYGDSVILGTGGYIGNTEMMNEYLDGPVNTVACTFDDGAGIRMAQSAGAALYSISVPPMIHITQVRNMIKNNDLTADQKAILSALCLVTDQKNITTKGEVWQLPQEICMAPNYMYYVVYTAEQMEDIKTNGLSASFERATSYFLGQGGTFEIGKPITDMDTILEVGVQYGNVLKADSIAGLAAQIGCDANTLSASLDGKDGAYYAVIAAGYAYGTVGGVDVDVNMNALRENGMPIENLFVVGQDSEGVCNINTKPYTPWGGQAQSWTFVSGKLAGTSAAAYGMAK